MIPIAADAALFAERLPHGLTEGDADVLHAVVIVHVRVALALHREVKPPVGGKECQHVVEKAHAGVDLADAHAVEVERKGDFRLRGGSVDIRSSHMESSCRIV